MSSFVHDTMGNFLLSMAALADSLTPRCEYRIGPWFEYLPALQLLTIVMYSLTHSFAYSRQASKQSFIQSVHVISFHTHLSQRKSQVHPSSAACIVPTVHPSLSSRQHAAFSRSVPFYPATSKDIQGRGTEGKEP